MGWGNFGSVVKNNVHRPYTRKDVTVCIQYSVQYNIHSVIDWFALLIGAPWRLPTHQTKYKCNEEEGGKEETRSTIHYTDTQGMMLVSSLNG